MSGDEKEYRKRKVEDALWWVEQNYCGKKVELNPARIIFHDNQELIVPHKEEILVEALKIAEEKCNLRLNWEKYEHYKRIMRHNTTVETIL